MTTVRLARDIVFDPGIVVAKAGDVVTVESEQDCPWGLNEVCIILENGTTAWVARRDLEP